MSPGAAVTACSVLWEGSGGEGRTVPGERGGKEGGERSCRCSRAKFTELIKLLKHKTRTGSRREK